MQTKRVFIDCETTGLSYEKNGLIEIGGVIDIDGKVVEEFSINAKPFPNQIVSKQAMSVNGIEMSDLRNYPEPSEAYEELQRILGKHIDRYNKHDKAFLYGYHIFFDAAFLRRFFENNEDQYFASWFWWPYIDVASLYCEASMEHRVHFENFKLENICKWLNIDVNIHNALSDAQATRAIYYKMLNGEI